MDKLRRDALIDDLLVFVNEEVESKGSRISNVTFDFSESGEDAVNFLKQKAEITYDKLDDVLKVCISREYLKKRYSGRGHFGLGLTEEGQGRAISIEAAKHATQPRQHNSGNIHIGTINSSGPTQIGNQNVQNVENVLVYIIEQIDNADASEEQKQEAKNRLQDFLKHPIVSAIIGVGATLLANTCGGQ